MSAVTSRLPISCTASTWCRRALILAVGSGLLAAAAEAMPERLFPRTVQLYEGVQRTFELDADARRVAVGDPEVVEVELVETDTVLITPVGSGATSLQIWTEGADTPQRTLLMVSPDTTISARGGYPDGDVTPDIEPQVQADIRVVEVSRQRLQQVGSRLFLRRGSSNFAFGGSGVLEGEALVPGEIDALSGAITGREGFNIVYGGGGRNVLAAINALERSGYAHTLAEPSLVALSGQSASFLAGGEFPVPVRGAGVDGTQVTIEFREFGVRLSLTPTVLDGDRIMLKVAPEVSELDFTQTVQSGGVEVPSLRVRRTDTSITLGDGESFVISGLISTRGEGEVDKLPVLGDLPIIGAFFRETRVESEERELLMVVTPRLVRPIEADASTPKLPGETLRNYSPDFWDLFLFEDGSFTGGEQ